MTTKNQISKADSYHIKFIMDGKEFVSLYVSKSNKAIWRLNKMFQGNVKYSEFLEGGWKTERFKSELHIRSMYSGRSAKGFIAYDENDHAYTFFIKDFLDMLQKVTIVNGKIYGVWGWKKRGQNFGIYYVRS